MRRGVVTTVWQQRRIVRHLGACRPWPPRPPIAAAIRSTRTRPSRAPAIASSTAIRRASRARRAASPAAPPPSANASDSSARPAAGNCASRARPSASTAALHGAPQALPRSGHLERLRQPRPQAPPPRFADVKLTALRAPDIEDWLVELASEGQWSTKTLNNALKTLVVCLNWAQRGGLIPGNPAAVVPTLPDDYIERDYLRLNEINAYIDACSDEYRPLPQTLIGTYRRVLW